MQIFFIFLPFSITQPAKQLKNANEHVVLTVFEKTRVGQVKQAEVRHWKVTYLGSKKLGQHA